MNYLILSDLEVIEDEPRVRDLKLAESLGFAKVQDIRELIARNYVELQTFGGIPCRTENSGPKGGRPGRAYYLNEGQALVICALSRTPTAAKVRKALIDVFMAYRRGELVKTVHVDEHWRRPPIRRGREHVVDIHGSMVSFFKAYRNQPEVLADWACSFMEEIAQATQAFSGVRR